MNEDPNLSTPGLAISRADGVTKSERYRKTLFDRRFLSLWSYPGVYRDQGRSGKGDGKDLCAFPDSDDLTLDWSQWFRRAVKKSADQVWGAERWIRAHPDSLFIDCASEHEFPIDCPTPIKRCFTVSLLPTTPPTGPGGNSAGAAEA